MNNDKELLLSAILVIPGTFTDYQRTMECLKSQTIAGNIEIVMVSTSKEQLALKESELRNFHSFKIVEIGKVKSMGSANAAGVFQASAPVIALTEDHSFIQNDWAELFVKRHQEKWAVVGPNMRNGNPADLIGWADFLQAYVEWMAPAGSGIVRHLPGHNSSYKKDILLGFGPELETLMEAESILHRRLAGMGHEFYLESGLCTTHLNFNSWSAYIPCRYYTGRQFAGTWSARWPWYRRALFTIASPGIPFLRLWNIYKATLKKKPRQFPLRAFFVIFVGLVIEAAGQFMAYLCGYGDSIEKVMQYEFNRTSFLKGA
jgi:hypothetical protein